MKRFFALSLLALAACAPGLSRAAEPEQEFVVIVNATNPVQSLSRSQLLTAFLKKIHRWPSGKSIHVTEPSASASGARSAFCRDIHGRSLTAVTSYWQQQVFSGQDVPPLEWATEDAVVAFVAATPGAVGYVSPQTKLSGGVRVVAIRS